jgi:hypothetical protein
MPFLLLLAIAVVVFLLWPYPVLYPLKLLVVFFHESSHALMTVVTGGRVVELVVNEMQGGHVISNGGNRFLTLTAGYLGSLLWGSAIYLLAVRSIYDKLIMSLLGLTIIALCAFFVRDLFALAFGGLVATAMLITAAKVSVEINDLVLRIIGITSLLYVPLDIYSDTIERSGLRSDAVMLAEEFGGTGMLWGGIWLLLSLVIIVATLVLGLKMAPTRTSQEISRPDWSLD